MAKGVTWSITEAARPHPDTVGYLELNFCKYVHGDKESPSWTEFCFIHNYEKFIKNKKYGFFEDIKMNKEELERLRSYLDKEFVLSYKRLIILPHTPLSNSLIWECLILAGYRIESREAKEEINEWGKKAVVYSHMAYPLN